MKVENPAALHFIMQDELFFLKSDKAAYAVSAPLEETVAVMAAAAVETRIPLAETKPIPAAPPVTTPLNFNYQGKNRKNFLVIVHYPSLEFIAEAHLTALENILKRKDLGLDDVAILNRARYETADFESLLDFFAPAKILLLGKNALPGGMETLVLNEPKKTGKAVALYSYSFDEMMESNELKKAFWEQMKNL